MSRREVKRLLTDNGFKPVRYARHGKIYTDGVSQLMLSHRHDDPRAIKNFKRSIERAVELRGKTK